MENNINNFTRVMYLKHELVNTKIDQLIEKYYDTEKFISFLDDVKLMNEVDTCFLLLDDSFINKIEKISMTQRFNIKNEKYISLINDFICYTNDLQHYPENKKNILLNNYLAYHEDVRQLYFNDHNDFIYALGYDANVYDSLQEGNLDNLDETLFFGSTNYFLETIPELYQNPTYINLTISKLKQMSKRYNIFNFTKKRNIQITIENFQKVKSRKEE